MSSFDTIVGALEPLGTVKHEGSGKAMAQCPSHDDNKASLSIKHLGDKVGVHCFAGCHAEDIVFALGLELKDLFDDEPEQSSGPTLIRSYLYETHDGTPWFYKDRFFPKTFMLRLPGEPAGQSKGLQGRVPVLYRLPQLMAARDQVLWICEGEKDADTAARHNMISTTSPFGAGGRWEMTYTQAIKRAGVKEVRVVVDRDEKGREFGIKVRAAMRSVGIPVRVLRPKEGKDLTEHFEKGHSADDFVIETEVTNRPRGMAADTLLARDIPPLAWCVPNMLPQGFAILAGNPKCGKSWTALDIALAVAMGGKTLGGFEVVRGSVLYLAREDSYRRLRSRMRALLGTEASLHDLSKLELLPGEEEWIGGAEGVSAMEDWAEEVGDPRLVILDTWAKVEPRQESGDSYRSDYAMTSRYKQWADRHSATVLVIHHSTKADSSDGDVFTKISGTRGFTGAADTMMFLERGENHEGTLHLTGRDVADQQLPLVRSGPLWLAMGLLEPVSW